MYQARITIGNITIQPVIADSVDAIVRKSHHAIVGAHFKDGIKSSDKCIVNSGLSHLESVYFTNAMKLVYKNSVLGGLQWLYQ